jgi:hypothetical protein
MRAARESAGNKNAAGGRKIGDVHLKLDFSEAAVLFLRKNPAGQKYCARLTKKHGKGKALGVLAAKLGRAVYYMLQRHTPFDLKRFVTVRGAERVSLTSNGNQEGRAIQGSCNQGKIIHFRVHHRSIAHDLETLRLIGHPPWLCIQNRNFGGRSRRSAPPPSPRSNWFQIRLPAGLHTRVSSRTA